MRVLGQQFCCSGSVTSSKEFKKSFGETEIFSDHLMVFGKPLTSSLVFSEFSFFDHCRKSFMILHANSVERGLRTTDTSLQDIRYDISNFLNFILFSMKSLESRTLEYDINLLMSHLQSLRLLFHRFSLARLPDHSIAHYAATFGSNMTNPASHLVHCHLDFRWIFINILQTIEKINGQSGCHTQGSPNLSADDEVMILLNELIWLALVRYEKSDKNELYSLSVFSCSCVKELWLLLVHFKFSSQDFWFHFEQVLRAFIETREPPSSPSYNSQKIESVDFLPCSNRNEFAVWLLADITRLVHFDSNCEHVTSRRLEPEQMRIVDDIIRTTFAEDLSETEARNLLPLLHKILGAFDHYKSAPVLLIAEYFFKKINSTFYMPGSKLNTNVVLSKSAQSLLDDVKSRLDGFVRDKRENSYMMFLRLLGEHVKSIYRNDVSSSRLSSRMFLKFPVRPDKYSEYLQAGICHLSMLFLVLAIGSKTPSIVHRLVGLLACAPKEGLKDSTHEMIWKGYGASMLTLAELRADLSESSSHILTHVDWCISKHSVAPMSHFIDALRPLFEYDVTTMKGVHNLLGPWIVPYVEDCRKNDIARLQKVFIPLLHNLVDSLGTSESQSLKLKVEQYLVPILNREENATSAELAALLALISPKCRSELFHHWSNHENYLFSGKFLLTIWKSRKDEAVNLFPNFTRAVQQVWVLCCYLWNDKTDIAGLGSCISQLPQASAMKLDLTGPNPFKSFLEVFSFEYTASQTLYDKCTLRTFFLSFFSKFSEMIVSKCDALDYLDLNLLPRFYENTSELVAQCPFLVYSKSDPHCLLRVVVDVMILPRVVYKPGHKWPNQVLTVIAQYLPRFMEGLYALGDSDPYVKRAIRNIYSIYLPRMQHMAPDTHPIGELLSLNSAPTTLQTLVDILTCKESPMSSTATLIFKNLCEVMKWKPELSSIIFNNTAEAVINQLITEESFQSWHSHVIDFFSNALNEHVNRVRIANILLAACQSHLSRHSTSWFNLIRRLAPLCRIELAAILPQVTQHVEIIEKQRGVERDSNLRQILSHLELALGST